jgi:hypothetical protein
VLADPPTIDLSNAHLRYLARQLTMHRREIGSRWRRLTAGRQALLVLAHLRCGDTYAQLAAGFGIGIATVFRYIREAIEILAALAPNLTDAVQTASRLPFVILDGTLLPIDRIAADTLYYSGKHKRHGMNIQVLTDPFGWLLWASPALPGSTHDLAAARTRGIIDALTEAGIRCWADKASQGAGRPVPRPTAQAVAAPAQHHPRQDPLRRRAGHGHSQGLAPAAETPQQAPTASPTS